MRQQILGPLTFRVHRVPRNHARVRRKRGRDRFTPAPVNIYIKRIVFSRPRYALATGCQWLSMTDLHRWPRRAARWVPVPRDPAYRRPRCPSRVPAPVHRSRAASICTLTWGISTGRAARCRTLTTMSIAATTRKSTPRRTPARSTRSTLRSVPLDPRATLVVVIIVVVRLIVSRTFLVLLYTPPSLVPRRKILPKRVPADPLFSHKKKKTFVSLFDFRFIQFLDDWRDARVKLCPPPPLLPC